jgi:hypothetical protein
LPRSRFSWAETKLPAKLSDLPGYGSPNAIHDEIVKNAWINADCFIYVTNATRSLAAEDISLLRVLYTHHMEYRKPVVWVLTAIDLKLDLTMSNEPAWKATLDQNNAYLKEHFSKDFVGEGFVPVSPALEAQADRLAREGNEALSRRYAAESRMSHLRRILEDLIDRETGWRHIASIAGEARTFIAPRSRILSERLQAELLPIEQLADQLAHRQTHLRHIDALTEQISEQLSARVERGVRAAARPFTKLTDHLHHELDPLIHMADLRDQEAVNRVELAKTQALREWMKGAAGPATIWEKNLEAIKNDALRMVRVQLNDQGSLNIAAHHVLDVEELTASRYLPPRTEIQDILQRAATVVGVTTPITAGAISAFTAATVATVAVPAGAVAGMAALVWAAVRYRQSKATSLDLLRQERIRALNQEAVEIENEFKIVSAASGMSLVDNIIENLSQYRSEIEESIISIQARMADEDSRDRRELINQLQPVCAEGTELMSLLGRLAQV